MKIIYKNFIITGDERDYTLTELWKSGDKAKNVWEEIIKNQTYHPTIERALMKIMRNTQINKKNSIDLQNIVENLKKEYSIFLKDLKELLNK